MAQSVEVVLSLRVDLATVGVDTHNKPLDQILEEVLEIVRRNVDLSDEGSTALQEVVTGREGLAPRDVVVEVRDLEWS